MIRPDRNFRLDGTTYPDDDRAPKGSRLLLGRGRSFRELIAETAMRFSLKVLKAQEKDVLVIRGAEDLSPAWRRGANKAVRDAGLHAAVFLPMRCRVHVEPSKLNATDLGYRETMSYGEDANGKNLDRGVWVGTPEDVPDPCA